MLHDYRFTFDSLLALFIRINSVIQYMCDYKQYKNRIFIMVVSRRKQYILKIKNIFIYLHDLD